ncbi:MAG: YkgJ family cysteine cluster protein [Proteobacteria bacterium]|nr:YkgJ family cysteine cluster protein [Pseudomonadota bacterium]
MQCRSNCGACCVAPSISQPFWGMPRGKPAGVACVHLTAEAACALFNDLRRPAVCANFKPDVMVCGQTREEALHLLQTLEVRTAPTC